MRPNNIVVKNRPRLHHVYLWLFVNLVNTVNLKVPLFLSEGDVFHCSLSLLPVD